jgi:hypothetical protein
MSMGNFVIFWTKTWPEMEDSLAVKHAHQVTFKYIQYGIFL